MDGTETSPSSIPVRVANNGDKHHRPPLFIHARHTCDGCTMSPILGNRYRRYVDGKEDNFDYCEDCYQNAVAVPDKLHVARNIKIESSNNDEHQTEASNAIKNAGSLPQEISYKMEKEGKQSLHLRKRIGPIYWPSNLVIVDASLF